MGWMPYLAVRVVMPCLAGSGLNLVEGGDGGDVLFGRE